MSPKRPPARERPPVTKEWDPTDTQSLRVGIDLASETRWRHDVVSKLEPMAATLAEVRDLARETDVALAYKASKEALAEQAGRIELLTNNVRWLRWLTLGVLVVGVLEKLAEKKGIL